MATTVMRGAALLIACAALGFHVSPVRASPLGDAKAGQAALDQGDNATAIRLFTRALNSGGLSHADRELAYVKRAKAYAAEQSTAAALADVRKALKLDPNDREALDLLGELKFASEFTPKQNNSHPWVILEDSGPGYSECNGQPYRAFVQRGWRRISTQTDRDLYYMELPYKNSGAYFKHLTYRVECPQLALTHEANVFPFRSWITEISADCTNKRFTAQGVLYYEQNNMAGASHYVRKGFRGHPYRT